MSVPAFKLTVGSTDLTVVEVEGYESISAPFEYRLVCQAPDNLRLAEAINEDAVYTVKPDEDLYGEDIFIRGYITDVSAKNGLWTLCLRPKLLLADTNNKSEIFYNESGNDISDIIDYQLRADADNSGTSLNISLGATLPVKQLICQYQESNFSFFSRLTEHWGIYYYFDHFENQLVVADGADYLDFIDGIFKTQSGSSQNDLMKFYDWEEKTNSRGPVQIKVVGYNPQTASTLIEEYYPADKEENEKEITVQIGDIESSDEASYLAQARYEAMTGMRSYVVASHDQPVFYPGFIVNTDDDGDFAQAVVISCKHRGQNLAALRTVRRGRESSEVASYEVEVTLIPATVGYRPPLNTPQPEASSLIGKVVSDTQSSLLPQRNEFGRYKVSFNGFINDYSALPWLRKAQATAGMNSHDMPLSPGTEVSIGFHYSNPNCPYIQYALENSSHPAPVTHANPNHAVIKTEGMLLFSSKEGRYNYSTTVQHNRADDSALSGTIKNYYTNRGAFDQNNNFIDPSDTSVALITDADESSGDYIITRHYGDAFEIREGDKLHWHNGNLYDFGGYWNYNLGNSYEENFIDQEAPLNIKVQLDSRSGDILENTGPDWTSVDFSQLEMNGLSSDDVTPSSYGTTGIDTTATGKTFSVNTDGAWGAGGMNVSKSYNASYDYKFGEGIDVSDRVNSLEVTHTDANTANIEMTFHNGVLRAWEKKKNRETFAKTWNSSGQLTSDMTAKKEGDFFVTEETTWHGKGQNHKSSWSKSYKTDDSRISESRSYNVATGALAAYNTKVENGMGSAEMDFSYSESAKSSFNFGGTTSFSLSAQRDVSLAISFSGNLNMKIDLSGTIDIDAGFSNKISVDLNPGVELKFNAKGRVKADVPAAQLVSELRASVYSGMVDLVNKNTALEKSLVSIKSDVTALDQSSVKLNTAYTCIFV
ncbi:MAG: hypothetical protein CMI08_12715 [Oceanospirillaceae bacterium]|uniref:type VI secretion system Vgr family protein n=1 Tax=unclassified Thalassolituus TaxID=2624967 RepID=UPI000C397354|nr:MULTISPECIES: contractile injection system protein, VgrG/Pvc8 family [unclassified Thalassolituus]MAS25492.1 hypothetical protein [Oceanospirillaceae bacterium]MAY00034.1 hypothetical protein [Oceanospirillaceae bacterium]MBL36277.1 hypothetical protein [Oceanospirillaceae bacterium]MBS53794.1 hypothetical protein [Oceanospirillaceae bacterium]|tara:strand:+ start:2354 stop:5155 length:2802 start_codon:yes stop_codon:yes gene_type:complete